MKKLVTLSALAASTCFFAASTFAESFSLNVNGNITDTTCAATIDKTTLNMDTINKSTFTNAGSAAIGSDFTITIKDCPAVMSKAEIAVKGTPDAINSNLFAIQALAGSADGVGIQVKSDAGVVVPNGKNTYQLTNGAVTAQYLVDYISTKPTSNIKAGTVKSTINVEVSYQ